MPSTIPVSDSTGYVLPSVNSAVMERLRKSVEPLRTLRWVQTFFCADDEAEMTQIGLWQAYKRTFGPPWMQAADMLRLIVKIYPKAKMTMYTTEEGEKQYVVAGIRPAVFTWPPAPPPNEIEVREAIPSDGITPANLIKAFGDRIAQDIGASLMFTIVAFRHSHSHTTTQLLSPKAITCLRTHEVSLSTTQERRHDHDAPQRDPHAVPVQASATSPKRAQTWPSRTLAASTLMAGGSFPKWLKWVHSILLHKGLWHYCAHSRPTPLAGAAAVESLNEWDHNAVKAGLIIQMYVDADLLSRIPLESWESFQARRGLSGCFLSEMHRMLPNEIRSAALWYEHRPLKLTPSFGQSGFESQRTEVAYFAMSQAERTVDPSITSGYYLLQQLKIYAQPFRLLALPAELRKKVYAMCSSNPETVLIVVADKHRTYKPPPALTRASRQLRQEALPVYYETSNFQLVLDAGRPRGQNMDQWECHVLLEWMAKIGDMDLIRRIRNIAVQLQLRVIFPGYERASPQYRMADFAVTCPREGGVKAELPNDLCFSEHGKHLLECHISAVATARDKYSLQGESLLLLFFIWNPWLWHDHMSDNRYVSQRGHNLGGPLRKKKI